jgi:hypothetical protein
LPHNSAQAELVLADEVKRELEEARPENPGRLDSFPVWRIGQTRIEPLGWNLAIQRAWRVPAGWRALVYVTPIARTHDRRCAIVRSYHIEDYLYSRGELSLFENHTPPDSDPAQGLAGMIR